MSLTHVLDDAVITADGLSADDFKLAFRNHPAGVAIVTADQGDGPVGFTATSVFSVSAEPAIFVFSISTAASSSAAFSRAETAVVHLLGAGQLELAKLFATSGVDRFSDSSTWRRTPTGEPYLVDAPVRIRGRIIQRVAAGASTVVVVQALDAEIDDHGSPLVYHDRSWHHVGEHSLVIEHRSSDRK